MNFSSLNNGTWRYAHTVSIAEKTCFTVVYIILFLVAIVGNSFVIHVARKLLAAGRGPFSMMVINMAASDILYAVAIVPTQLTWLVLGLSWFPGGFGTFLCKFRTFAATFAVNYSILTLTTMTVDRYLAIVPNVKRPMTRKTVMKVILAIALISSAYSLFPIFRMNTYKTKTRTVCVSFYKDLAKDITERLRKAEYLCYFVLIFVLPVAVITVLYFRIIRFLWLRKIPGNRSDRNETQRRNSNKRITCMLITMATTFALTWLPLYVCLYYFVFDEMESLPYFIQTILFWIAQTNCATNPCFYFVFCKEYSNKLRHVLRRYICRNTTSINRVENVTP